jgi:hypothetical protein
MVHELFARVDALEKRLAAQQSTPAPAVAVAVDHLAEVKKYIAENGAQRGMCPKCGVKPNYFFHVRTCSGQKKNKKDADENIVRRRDQGTP